MSIQPFRIDIRHADSDDLHAWLARPAPFPSAGLRPGGAARGGDPLTGSAPVDFTAS